MSEAVEIRLASDRKEPGDDGTEGNSRERGQTG